MSVPVVVTVHGNQQCDAEATVFWDNAFAEKVSQTPPEACRACKVHRTLEQITKVQYPPPSPPSFKKIP